MEPRVVLVLLRDSRKSGRVHRRAHEKGRVLPRPAGGVSRFATSTLVGHERLVAAHFAPRIVKPVVSSSTILVDEFLRLIAPIPWSGRLAD